MWKKRNVAKYFFESVSGDPIAARRDRDRRVTGQALFDKQEAVIPNYPMVKWKHGMFTK